MGRGHVVVATRGRPGHVGGAELAAERELPRLEVLDDGGALPRYGCTAAPRCDPNQFCHLS